MAQVEVTVQYCSQRVVHVAALSCSVAELKRDLARKFNVPVEGQRLLFGGAAAAAARRLLGTGRPDADRDARVELRDLLSPAPRAGEREPVASAPGPGMLKLSLMLVGESAQTAAATAASLSRGRELAELSELVVRSLETDSCVLTCSYASGYCKQAASICLTCAATGEASQEHVMCQACATLCHAGHHVEDIGVWYSMRCDCCTKACWKHSTAAAGSDENTPRAKQREGQAEGTAAPFGRCSFLVDSSTGDIPARVKVPLNKRNTYPRDVFRWCYCKKSVLGDATASADEGSAAPSSPSSPLVHGSGEVPLCGSPCHESPTSSAARPVSAENDVEDAEDGESFLFCTMCHSIFFYDHIRSIHTEYFRYMPCYGEVYMGTVVTYRCNTCATAVCASCRLRCHKDHDVDPAPIVVSSADKADTGEEGRCLFSCGCKGLCSIAEAVPEEERLDDDRYMAMPEAMVADVMTHDVFADFICAHCMQEHPWLVEHARSPKHCFNGALPAKVPPSDWLPVLPCGGQRNGPPRGPATSPPGPVPAPAPSSGPVFPYHGMLVPTTFFTPEMNCGCVNCEPMFERLFPRNAPEATDLIVPSSSHCCNCGVASQSGEPEFVCKTCEMAGGSTFFVCSTCYANYVRNGMRQTGTTLPGTNEGLPPAELSSVEQRQRQWHHDPAHEFIEDSFDNMWALRGMQALQQAEPSEQQWLASQWKNEGKELFLDYINRSFGPRAVEPDSQPETPLTRLSTGGQTSAFQEEQEGPQQSSALAATPHHSTSAPPHTSHLADKRPRECDEHRPGDAAEEKKPKVDGSNPNDGRPASHPGPPGGS